jgi:hypothetical protein
MFYTYTVLFCYLNGNQMNIFQRNELPALNSMQVNRHNRSNNIIVRNVGR